MRFLFPPFELDASKRRLTSSGEPVALSDRLLDVLMTLTSKSGHIIAKDDLLRAGWGDVAVGDNSLEQAISSLRRILGEGRIETVPRRGYRFTAAVEHRAARETDADLEAILAPHRAFVEGRAALETLQAERVAAARRVFEEALSAMPEYAPAQIGMASACVLQFEMTRADPAPDGSALALALHHAREACRLDPSSGEAWATLGFALERTGQQVDALAASRRAVTLEPDNWRHHFRLAFVAWGEERLRAAHRALALIPGFPLAHWLAATVHVARQAFVEAERELEAAVVSADSEPFGRSRFSAVALHWLLGSIYLARGDDSRAMEQFEAELGRERRGHLYARECCANTWYAIGAMRLRQGHASEARDAFGRAIDRVAAHRMARVGLAAAGVQSVETGSVPEGPERADHALSRAAELTLAGHHADAARSVEEALLAAAPGNAAWHLPVEPLLHVAARPDVWGRALSQLRNRAT